MAKSYVFNPFTGNFDIISVEEAAADTYSVWYYLMTSLFSNSIMIGDTNATLPGAWAQTWADAGNNELWYGTSFISIPVGYKAVASAFQAFAVNGTNNYFDNLNLRIHLANVGPPATRDRYILKDVANPFGTSADFAIYYTTSLTDPPDMYGRSDSTTNILDSITVIYTVNKSGGSGGDNVFFHHAVKIDYTKL